MDTTEASTTPLQSVQAPVRENPLVLDILRQLQELTAAVKALQAGLPSPLVGLRVGAKFADCSVHTLRRKVLAGEIAHRRIGTAIRIDLRDLAIKKV